MIGFVARRMAGYRNAPWGMNVTLRAKDWLYLSLHQPDILEAE